MSKLTFFTSLKDIPKDKSSFDDKGQRNSDFYILDAKIRIKIGISVEVRRRINDLQNISGFIFNEIAIIRNNGRELETLFKKTFPERKIIGEWYDMQFEHACQFFSDPNFKRQPFFKPKKTVRVRSKEEIYPKIMNISNSDMPKALKADILNQLFLQLN